MACAGELHAPETSTQANNPDIGRRTEFILHLLKRPDWLREVEVSVR